MSTKTESGFTPTLISIIVSLGLILMAPVVNWLGSKPKTAVILGALGAGLLLNTLLVYGTVRLLRYVGVEVETRPPAQPAASQPAPAMGRQEPKRPTTDGEVSRSVVDPSLLRWRPPEQLAKLRRLLRVVVPQDRTHIWLSGFFQLLRGHEEEPPMGAIDYPDVLRELAKQGEIEILESVDKKIADRYGEVFREDIRFRVIELKENSRPSRSTEVSPPPLRRPLAEQVSAVRSLLRQMQAQGHAEMWLSQLFSAMRGGGLDDIPVGGVVDYGSALREMATQGEIEIFDSAERELRDFWGEIFREDLRFRIVKLRENQGAKQ